MPEEIQDDISIEDNDGILRRVPNWPDMVKFDANMNAYRATSACFSDKDEGRELSITLERPLLDSGHTHQYAIAQEPRFGLARLIVGFVRHEIVPAQKLIRAPTDDDEFHGLMIGEKSKRAKKALVKAAILVIQPTTT